MEANMAHHKTRHFTLSIPGAAELAYAAIDNPNSTHWVTKAMQARDKLGFLPIGYDMWEAITGYIVDNTDTPKDAAVAFETAIGICQKAIDKGYLDKLTPEAVAHDCGCLPNWIYKAEADDYADEQAMYNDLRAGG
jgi:hypothetical protein